MVEVAQSVVELDELRIVIVVDNETDGLSSIDEGVPQVSEIAGILQRVPSAFEFEGHECKQVLEHMCCACHGFSALVSGRSGDEERVMLFDVGPYPDIWLRNAERLAIDLSRIETLFLSHWHADHSGGFPEVVAAIAAARRQAGLEKPLVVDLHPDRPDQRGVLLPSGTMFMLPEEPTFAAIEAAGGLIEKHDQPHPLCGGFFFGSGEIERETSYETGLAGHHTFRGGKGVPDPLIMDERYLAARVKGRGTTILSACSHAGVVNVCRAAQTAFDRAAIDTVLGGYHLAGAAMEKRIPETIRDLKDQIRPAVVAPGHCTGWRAKAALSAAFAPGRYAPSLVGSTYWLTGS
ncbi:MAG: MBL fold metallo-hydrolase [bacterium]